MDGPDVKRHAFRILIALCLLALLPGRAYSDGGRVAVFPVKNNGQATYNSLAAGIASMLATDLMKSKDLDVVDPVQVDKALDKTRLAGGAPSADAVMKAAKTLDADYAVTGEFVVFGGKFRIDVRVYDVKAGTLKMSDKAQAKEDAFFEMVDELSDKVIFSLVGMLPSANGALQVVSDPPGAYLILDDNNKVGNTPATVDDLTPGSHKIQLELAGYKPYTQSAVVKERETFKVEAKLQPLLGGIRVWWRDYPVSDVSIGSEIVKMTQFQYNVLGKFCRNMPFGHYTVSVRLPYKEESAWDNTRTWRTYTADLDLAPGEVTDIYIMSDTRSPGLEINKCVQCESNWDFGTEMVWFEMQ